MDYYAIIEQKVNDLRAEIVDCIRKVLIEEKGWNIGDRVVFRDDITRHEYAFLIMNDRILYGENYHGDSFLNSAWNIANFEVDALKDLLHEACHVYYNNNK
jgi:hypothetical protein